MMRPYEGSSRNARRPTSGAALHQGTRNRFVSAKGRSVQSLYKAKAAKAKAKRASYSKALALLPFPPILSF